MRILLENGADISIKNNNNGNTVYHLIPWHEDITIEERKEIFSQLLQYDDSLFDEPEAHGYTPFSFTLVFGQYEMIDFFLEHGASVSKALNCGDPDLKTLLQPYNKEYLMKLLNNCTGLLNGKDDDGNTLLMLGIAGIYDPEIDYETFKTLAEKYENIDQETPEGITAFMLAVALNKLDVARLLIDMGADKNHKNILGQDAIMFHEAFQKELGNSVNSKIDLFDNPQNGATLRGARNR